MFNRAPAGDRIAYMNTEGDRRSVVVAELDGANATPLVSETDAEKYLDLRDWSPDGSKLLIQHGELGAVCGVDCRAFGTVVHEVIDLTGAPIWQLDASERVTGVTWAGADRLLISQPAVNVDEGPVEADVRLLELPTGEETSLLGPIGEECCLSVSPDGMLAISLKVSPSSGDPRCVVVEVRTGRELVATNQPDNGPASCDMVSWTADGSLVLSSFSGI